MKLTLKLSFYITILMAQLLVFKTEVAGAALKCEDIFNQDVQKTQITGLNSLGKAMTEGMLLNPHQGDIFEVYRKLFMGEPSTEVAGKTLKSVTDILAKHSDLKKQHFPEYIISTVEKIYQTPDSLDKFVKSQISTAGQVRNNLFQIAIVKSDMTMLPEQEKKSTFKTNANIEYWKRILDYKDQELPGNLKPLNLGKNSTEQEKSKARDINKARADFQFQSQQRFIKYLNRIINKSNRELLADLKSDNTAYYQKAKALFETLKYVESWMSKKGRNTQAIRQAMYDLVFTIGYGNRATLELLKSTNGLEKVEGLQKLWNEADSLAEDLKYPGHLTELKEKLQIDFPTGLSKNEDFTKIIQNFEQEVLKSPFTTKPTDSVRVRSLSIQESPFRSCLGADCSTRTYFDKALDPNYIYFTITDSNHHSSGHATVVLGTATNKKTGEIEQVAFLDKLQNIPNQQIELFLDAVNSSLQENGYQLAIPTYLGKDIRGHGGLSNMDVITDFVQMNIMPRLDQILTSFNPHAHQYKFENGYSRGNQKLEVRIFNPKTLDENTEIRPGIVTSSYLANGDLNKKQLSQDFVSLKKSENAAERMKFVSSISVIPGLERLGIYSKHQFLENLKEFIENPNEDFVLRKKSLVEYISVLGINVMTKNNFIERFSSSERIQIFSELKNWQNSEDKNKKNIGVWACIEAYKQKGIFSYDDLKSILEAYEFASSTQDTFLNGLISKNQIYDLMKVKLFESSTSFELRKEIIYELLFGQVFVNIYQLPNHTELSIFVKNFTEKQKNEIKNELLSWEKSDNTNLKKRYDRYISFSQEICGNYWERYSLHRIFLNSIGLLDLRLAILKAAKRGASKQVFESIIEHGGRLDSVDSFDRNVLDILIRNNYLNEELITLFHDRERMNSVGPNGLTPLTTAIIYSGTGVIRLLQKNGASKVDVDKLKELFTEIIEIYKNSKFDFYAISTHTEMIVNINKFAPELTEYMLSKLSEDDKVALAGFVSSPKNLKKKLFNNLIKTSKPNEKYGPRQETLLHYFFSDYKQIEQLVKAGWNIDSQSVEGETPLHYAAAKSELEGVKALIKMGARMDIYDDEGSPAAYVAGMARQELTKKSIWPKVVAAIVQSGGSVLLQNGYGGDILHRAMNYSYNDLAKVLVQNGVKTNNKNDQGYTPADVARIKRNKEGLEILENTKRIYFPDRNELFRVEE